MAIFSPNLKVLYAARVVQGLGLGPLTVTCPMSIVEIAPAEIRGLLTAWFTLLMGIGLFAAVFCTLGVYLHVPVGNLQFQIVWLTPMILMGLCMAATFFIQESPRWLFMVQRREEAITTLVKIRGLSIDNERVQHEICDIEDDINRTAEAVGNSSFLTIAKETFTIPSNIRRVQQSLICYALAQLSGANLITSYFVPILAIVGVKGDTSHSMFLSGMYGVSKFIFILIATFLFIDILGRRKSLFIGAGLQMVTHIYLAVYVRSTQQGAVSEAASNAAIAALFVHAFGYGVGKFCISAGVVWRSAHTLQVFSFYPTCLAVNYGRIAFDLLAALSARLFTGFLYTPCSTVCPPSSLALTNGARSSFLALGALLQLCTPIS